MKFRNQFLKYMSPESGGEGGGGAGGSDAGGSDEGGSDDNNGSNDNNGGGEPGSDTGDDGGADNGGQGFEMSPEQLHDYRTQYSNEDGDIDVDRLIGDLHQGKAKGTAPEVYSNDFIKTDEALKDYDVPVDSDPLIQSAMKWAKDNGVPQDKYQELIGGALLQLRDAQDAATQAHETEMKERWAKIDDAEARQSKVQTQMSNLLGEDFKAEIESLVKHPSGFLILETLAAKVRDPQINTGRDYVPTPAVTRESLQTLRAERDKAEAEGDKAKMREIQTKIDNGYKKLSEQGKL